MRAIWGLVLLCLVGSSAFANYPPAVQQLKLWQGMNFVEVQEVLGVPDATIQTTCGGSGKKFSCRLWFYRDTSRSFHVRFAFEADQWLLESWGD